MRRLPLMARLAPASWSRACSVTTHLSGPLPPDQEVAEVVEVAGAARVRRVGGSESKKAFGRTVPFPLVFSLNDPLLMRHVSFVSASFASIIAHLYVVAVY